MKDVIVVGAGPTGLTAAIAARSRGMRTLLLESRERDGIRAGSRAIFLHRVTLDRLDRICDGLGAEIAARGIAWRRAETCYAGRSVWLADFSHSVRPAPFTSLPQWMAEDMLLRTCLRLGVEFSWGDPVDHIEPARSEVLLRSKSGASHRAEYVVAADGPSSAVRRQLGIPMPGHTSTTSFAVIDVVGEPDPATAARVFHYRHPAIEGRNVLLVPFRGGWRVDVQCHRADDPWTLVGSAPDWLPSVLPAGVSADISWASVYRFHTRVAQRFADETGRVMLAGDAAHLLPPFGARGLNSGIADAKAAIDTVATTETATYETVRRSAAKRNAAAARVALSHLEAERFGMRGLQRAAARIAPAISSAGRWLDSAPYGPRLPMATY